MPFACIFVPDFPVEAVLRAEPELRAQAVGLLEGKPPQQKLFALNEKARRAGLDPGMTKLQAEACSGLALRCRSAVQEAAAHAALLDCAQSFSPRVEDTACDTVVLDISGTEHLFGAPPKIARDLARRASDLGLEANVAVASNPDAATLAARGYPGIIVVATGEEEERLGDLPLHVLLASVREFTSERIAELLEMFDRWGVRNLRALAALPALAISERMGQEGVRLQKLARGAMSRTLVPVDLPLVFEEAIELEYPVVLLEPLAFLLGRLLDQICARLAARALATQELHLKLELETGIHLDEEDAGAGTATENNADDGETDTRPRFVRTAERGTRNSSFSRTLRLPVPMLDAKVFLKLLQLDLKAHPPGAPIRKIWLSAEPARSRAAQGGLFLPPSPEPEKLELTMARIAGIVGEDKIGSIELVDTHRPEGFLMQHFNPFARDKKSNPNTQDAAIVSRVTGLRIFRPALSACVTLRDGKPGHIACPKKKEILGEVIWQAGPWRSSGDWWEEHAWARDEWDIALQTTTGVVLYRLVRDLLSGRWLVEGTYD
jgi:protein ImuB